jgi:hypothetical protein
MVEMVDLNRGVYLQDLAMHEDGSADLAFVRLADRVKVRVGTSGRPVEF